MLNRSAPPAKTPLLLLLPGAAVAGFGLGLLGLAVTLPASVVTPLPVPSVAFVTEGIEAAAAAPTPATWAPLFGTPAPAMDAPPEPAPVPEREEAPQFADVSLYVLRGLIYEEGGGWALLETEDGIVVIRQGSILPGGEEVSLIAEDGVEVVIDSELYFIGFDDTGDDDTVSPYDGNADSGDYPPGRAPSSSAAARDWAEDEFGSDHSDAPARRPDPPVFDGPADAAPNPARLPATGGTAPRNPYGIGSVGR